MKMSRGFIFDLIQSTKQVQLIYAVKVRRVALGGGATASGRKDGAQWRGCEYRDA